MTTHPLVLQLRFTRNEFQRALEGVSDEEARKRFEPMNSISWIVGHLAWQEQAYWLTRGQGKILISEINELCGFDMPASTPPLDDMWQVWQTITAEADRWLDTLTTEKLTMFMIVDGQPHFQSIGSMLRRVTYHYWYHIGESQAIRQLLGHLDLPMFVGHIHGEAPYVPEV
jgi:hypothetical protein